VEMRGFPRKTDDPGQSKRAATARFNRAFTMTGRNGALTWCICAPRLALV
jgi:hypothetical protein